ncbi:transcription initiation factor IIB [Clydaea vesicula]|uniref:Transcription initiation factor IIB n=1 Tax=Clydaea vesicula TaxID=447962 RepID=A0AAD5U493_9FUNG|nr:transcription initiation factor IIB [Clydaea vesicula]
MFLSKAEIGPQLPTVNLNVKLICRDCRDPIPNLVEDFAQGDLICGNCGLVLGNRIIDTRSEWRTFSNSDDNSGDPSRIGGMSDMILGDSALDNTIIGGGTGVSGELNRAHGKSTNQKVENQVVQAFKDIQSMGDRVGMSKLVLDSAKQLFKKVEEEKMLRGKSTQAIMAACIYIGCREHNDTRTFKEICNLTNVPKKDLGRIYKQLLPLFESQTKKISIDSYISRFASQLDIHPKVQKHALKLCNRAIEYGTLAGKSPISLVAACLYFVSCLSDNPTSAKDIAEVSGCTEGTLRNAYKRLYEDRVKLTSNLPDFDTAKTIDVLAP